jgi:microcompartment protein CcmL/EutN
VVHIAELRLADDLGGRAFVILDGELTEVEAALAIGTDRIERETIHHTIVIPRLDADLRHLVAGGTRFAPCELIEPQGAELTHARDD